MKATFRRVMRGVECLEQKQMLAADPLAGMATDFVDDGNGYRSADWFVADSFSFGVEREMKESGEKSGTADINIGVGELQECTISKSMDRASPLLAQYAINGNSRGPAEIDFVETAGGGSDAGQGEQDRWFDADVWGYPQRDSGESKVAAMKLDTDGLVGPQTMNLAQATDEALAMIYVHIPGMRDV